MSPPAEIMEGHTVVTNTEFDCPRCGNRLKQERKVVRSIPGAHLVEVALGEGQFRCPACGFTEGIEQ